MFAWNFYRYLSVSNSVSIATDLVTEMFMDVNSKYQSLIRSLGTEILVANYRSL
jgi:hypothetical protein